MRDIFINHKGDAAGWSHSNQVGGNSFVKSTDAFFPSKEKRYTLTIPSRQCEYTNTSLAQKQQASLAPLAGGLKPSVRYLEGISLMSCLQIFIGARTPQNTTVPHCGFRCSQMFLSDDGAGGVT